MEAEERDLEQAAVAGDDAVEEMAARSAELWQEVDAVRQDWERKRADAGVPGAVPDDSKSSGADDGPPTGAPDGKR
jgi:hypothetical protein